MGDLIEDGKNGFLINKKNGISSFIAQILRIYELDYNNIDYIYTINIQKSQEFNINNLINTYLKIYMISHK